MYTFSNLKLCLENNDNNYLKPAQKQLCEKIFGMQKNTLPPDEKQILKEIVKYSNGKLKEEDLVVDVSIIRIKQSVIGLSDFTQ